MHVNLFIKKELYRDYLNYLFPLSDGCYQVTRDNEFGKMLCSRVQYSSLPVKTEPGTIRLQLPRSRPLANAGNYFLHYTKEDQAKLNDALDVLFHIDFDRYYLQGRKRNEMQKDIIQSFIITRKLVKLIGDNEMLKKRIYREEVENLKIVTEKLIKKAYYRNEYINNNDIPCNLLINNGL